MVVHFYSWLKEWENDTNGSVTSCATATTEWLLGNGVSSRRQRAHSQWSVPVNRPGHHDTQHRAQLLWNLLSLGPGWPTIAWSRSCIKKIGPCLPTKKTNRAWFNNLWWGAYQPVFLRMALTTFNCLVVAEGIYKVDTLALNTVLTNLISTSFGVYCLSGRDQQFIRP